MESVSRGRIVLTAAAITALYATTRLINLGGLPIHCDEALYLRWAQLGLENPALRWMALADGKQPMFVWLAMIALRFVDDPLLAGRLVSVIAGFVALGGIATLAGVAFRSRRAATAAGLLYVTNPFFLFYDRFAIYESVTVALVVWASVLIIVFTRTLRLDAALGLGIVTGLGWLTKSTTFLIVPFLGCALFFFRWRRVGGRGFLRWIGGGALAVAIAALAFSTVYLTPWAGEIGAKNRSFVFGFDEWSRAPLHMAWPNLQQIGPWLLSNLTAPVVLLAVAGVVLPASRRSNGEARSRGERLWLLACFAGPIAYLVLFGRHLHPRYVLLPCVPLLVLAARSLAMLSLDMLSLKGRAAGAVPVLPLALLLIWPAVYAGVLVVAPRHAPLVPSDRHGYLEGWSSGTGVRSLLERLDREAAAGPITVITEGASGLLPEALQLYRHENRAMQIVGLPQIDRAVLARHSSKRRTFLVLWSAEKQACAAAWPVTEVASWRRGPHGAPLALYAAAP